MAVSAALQGLAKDFCYKYACNFDFKTFESKVEEFTFLRPNNGWSEGYKLTFDKMYKQALVSAAKNANADLDGEAMLDDFEYTLIRPYVNENLGEIKHQPYVGMDRIARLEYLKQLTREAPSNHVALYTEKYKSGELSILQMLRHAEASIGYHDGNVEVAGYIQALENVNGNRSLVWRFLHPFKNSAEKRDAGYMKEMLIDEMNYDADSYTDVANAAYETFDAHKKANINLEYNMIRAREELDREKKMQDAIREPLS